MPTQSLAARKKRTSVNDSTTCHARRCRHKVWLQGKSVPLLTTQQRVMPDDADTKLGCRGKAYPCRCFGCRIISCCFVKLLKLLCELVNEREVYCDDGCMFMNKRLTGCALQQKQQNKRTRLKDSRPCQTMPDHARPCQTMPDHVRPCQTMPDHARQCRHKA